jgi:hypothetical protein
MIEVVASILALIAAVSVAYMLTIIDFIVHHQLYQFKLEFSYDWANPYWMVLRISMAFLGLIAVSSSINITYFLWKKLRRQEITKPVEETAKADAVPISAGSPTLFQCTSCGRSITHPLRMLDFHSQRPKMVNICPFCNATVVPVNYALTEEKAAPAEEKEEKIKKVP